MLKAITVLKALDMGIPVKISEYTYGLSDHNELCIHATSFNTSTFQTETLDVLLKVDYSVGGFLNLCETITEEEYSLICMNLTLNEHRRST